MPFHVQRQAAATIDFQLGPDEPGSPNLGDLWYDQETLQRWSGSAWEPISGGGDPDSFFVGHISMTWNGGGSDNLDSHGLPDADEVYGYWVGAIPSSWVTWKLTVVIYSTDTAGNAYIDAGIMTVGPIEEGTDMSSTAMDFTDSLAAMPADSTVVFHEALTDVDQIGIVYLAVGRRGSEVTDTVNAGSVQLIGWLLEKVT